MHSVNNITERKKIDTQSRADAYIRRKRLISKSYKSLDALKSIRETEKTLKTFSSGQKTPNKQKKTTGLGFFK